MCVCVWVCVCVVVWVLVCVCVCVRVQGLTCELVEIPMFFHKVGDVVEEAVGIRSEQYRRRRDFVCLHRVVRPILQSVCIESAFVSLPTTLNNTPRGQVVIEIT